MSGAKYEGELPENISVHLYNTATTALVNLVDGNLEKYAIGPKNTITVTLNTSPDQEKIEINIDGEVDDWN